MGAPLRISAAGSRSPAQRDGSRPLAPQPKILRLRADRRSLRISAAGSRSPAQRDGSRPLAPQPQILRLRADGRSAQDFGSRLPLTRSAGSLTPAGASTLQNFGFLFHNPERLLR